MLTEDLRELSQDRLSLRTGRDNRYGWRENGWLDLMYSYYLPFNFRECRKTTLFCANLRVTVYNTAPLRQEHLMHIPMTFWLGYFLVDRCAMV